MPDKQPQTTSDENNPKFGDEELFVTQPHRPRESKIEREMRRAQEASKKRRESKE